MFGDIEGFGLLYMMKVRDAERRRVHAQAVIEELRLDPRLEDLIPPRPARGEPLLAYGRVLDVMCSISALEEPERTAAIGELRDAVEMNREGGAHQVLQHRRTGS